MKKLHFIIISLYFGAESAPVSLFANTVEKAKSNPMSAAGLVEEATSYSEDRHYFDWRRVGLEIEVGYDQVDEANVYNSDGTHIGVSIPIGSGMSMRLGIRRFAVYNSRAGNNLSRTPFRQPALTNRYEVYTSFAYSILEGRSFSRLTPWLADLSHALQIDLGVHYHHQNDRWIPAVNDQPRALPGQRKINPLWVLEPGLRWTIYFPERLGLFFETRRHMTVVGGDEQLSQWLHYSTGLVWLLGYE